MLSKIVGNINKENSPKNIVFDFQIPDKSDINNAEFCRFGFYSGRNLLNAPTSGWFQWFTFPLNGNIKYPAQLGFWIDNHTNNVRMYTRSMSSATDNEIWSNWIETATKDYVNHFFQFPHLPIEKINVPANAVSHQQFEFDVPDGYRVVTGISKGCSGSSWCFVTYFTFGINSKGKNFVDYYVLNADSNSHEVSPKIVAILQRII